MEHDRHHYEKKYCSNNGNVTQLRFLETGKNEQYKKSKKIIKKMQKEVTKDEACADLVLMEQCEEMRSF